MDNLVLVIGDIIFDEYIIGEVTRISPEAPVPIVHITERKSTLGGAANVAANVFALNAKPVLVGLVGNDLHGKKFEEIANSKGVTYTPLYYESRGTTVKTRVIGNERQIIRIDDEDSRDISSTEELVVIEEVKRHISAVSVVIISDYGKGVCTEGVCLAVIELARVYGKSVLVDPKRADWTRYGGAYLIKPNMKEFWTAAGKIKHDGIHSVAQYLSGKFCAANIIVTKASKGMSLFSGNEVWDISAEAKDVYDVSGAGDTVIATVAVFLAEGEALLRSAEIANVAASIAVGKLGTYAVTRDELNKRLSQNDCSKLTVNVSEYVNQARRAGKSIVFTNGCFDILHTGHITLLRKAKALGDVLIVALNSDTSVRMLKGESRPINSEIERIDILTELQCVDAIVVFEEDTPYNLIKDIMPDIMVKGGDYTEDTIAGADVVKANGGKIEIIPLVEGKSTSSIIDGMQRNK